MSALSIFLIAYGVGALVTIILCGFFGGMAVALSHGKIKDKDVLYLATFSGLIWPLFIAHNFYLYFKDSNE